jgi:hypothetical protein
MTSGVRHAFVNCDPGDRWSQSAVAAVGQGMCEQPARSWRDIATTKRLVLALVALGSMAGAGVVNRSTDQTVVAVALLVFGGFVLISAVVMPTVQQVEFGLPVGLKVTAAVNDRATQLTAAFEAQRGELELCAQMLCDDPAVASRVLEAAWSRASATWHHPIGSSLRPYVLCLLLHLLSENQRLASSATSGPSARTPLSSLDFAARRLVVLKSFLDLDAAQMATLLGKPPGEVEAELEAAEQLLNSHGAT